MGDFVVYNRSIVNKQTHNAMLKTLSAQGSLNPLIIKHDSHNILIFEKNISPIVNFAKNEAGDFIASSGCFFYKHHFGNAALKLYLKEFNPNLYSPQDFLGVFTLILRKNNRLFITSDPLGASRIFRNADKSIWSSSFLAIAENMSRLTPNKQAIYEYCFQETNYGSDTPINEIKMADSLCYYELEEHHVKSIPKNVPVNFDLSYASYDDLIEEHAALLQKKMDVVTTTFENKVSTALSGGYDSRLMLALARNAGISPDVYVYGAAGSPDVTVAKKIAKGEKFILNHIDKTEHPKPNAQTYCEIVKDNFYALDGFPNEGIFDFGANMKTRRERTQSGKLILNGGGGEIYRNFFYLPDWSYSVNQLINTFYSRYTKDFCTTEFNEKEYRANLKRKIKHALQLKSDSMNRSEIEYTYPAFRLRYWTSKDNSNSNRLGSFLTPFLCYETISKALKIPLKYKNHGVFQGDLINKVSPNLAAYPSDYGFSFNEPVPFKTKVKNNLTIYRPSLLRRYSYSIQQKMATRSLPATLSPGYIDPLFQKGTPYMDQFFKMNEIKDGALLGRALTLEYLFQHLDL